ncbi:MAG TPA: alpha-amylase family glycosyl hydrolase [bacterium]|nr:alpha-amylase family glycosyl hydrolase [bacterium]HPS29596.1 alpha-amylase family glycosyl hydrolase [bacterium]
MKYSIFFLTLILLFSCDHKEISTSSCPAVIVTSDYKSDAELYIRGSFNKWQLSTKMEFVNGAWSVELNLPPGDHGYLFYDKSEDLWFKDEKNPLEIYIDDMDSSRLIVEDCRYPSLSLSKSPVIKDGSVTFDVVFTPGLNGEKIDIKNSLITLNNIETVVVYNEKSQTFSIDVKNLVNGKYSWLFKIKDKKGFLAQPLFVPVWIENEPFTWKDAVIYQIMTDRFSNGDTSNDNAIDGADFKANWQGGDFKGIIDKIDTGYFENAGINAIWISSPVRNTQKVWKGMGGDTRYYAAYHSYWPVTTGWTDLQKPGGFDSPLEPHFGTEAELDELIEKAHSKGIRVLFDLVPNHVHSESELWQDHENDGWFNDYYLCGWEKPLVCWFNEYLPDINHRNINALNAVTDHAVWLATRYNIDGFRVDAVRLMERIASSTLRIMLDRAVAHTGIPFYLVGETFTNDSGWNEIGYYLGSNLLQGQFDFPLFHHLSRTMLLNTETFNDLNAFLEVNDTRYQKDFYKDAIMSNFIGNHDICRALSVANGDFDNSTQGGNIANEKVWENSPGYPETEDPYKKLHLAHIFLMTTPGIPSIFQGDEFGMPGANDPDNRRMMTFDNELNEFQKATLAKFKMLGKFRMLHQALRHGTRKTISVSNETFVYSMSDEFETVIVALNRSNEPVTLEFTCSSCQNEMTELFTQQKYSPEENSFKITIEPQSGAVLY